MQRHARAPRIRGRRGHVLHLFCLVCRAAFDWLWWAASLDARRLPRCERYSRHRCAVCGAAFAQHALCLYYRLAGMQICKNWHGFSRRGADSNAWRFSDSFTRWCHHPDKILACSTARRLPRPRSARLGRPRRHRRVARHGVARPDRKTPPPRRPKHQVICEAYDRPARVLRDHGARPAPHKFASRRCPCPGRWSPRR